MVAFYIEKIFHFPGHDWLKRRNLLMPAFHSAVLQNYIPAFNKHAKILTQVLADHSKLNGCVDIENYAYRSTLNSIIGNSLGKCYQYKRISIFLNQSFSEQLL